MRILQNTRPKSVMSFFEDICAIPHGSGNTKKISEYCLCRAKEIGLDAISFGPNMEEIHTPSERLSISSVERSYTYLCKIIENI